MRGDVTSTSTSSPTFQRSPITALEALMPVIAQVFAEDPRRQCPGRAPRPSSRRRPASTRRAPGPRRRGGSCWPGCRRAARVCGPCTGPSTGAFVDRGDARRCRDPRAAGEPGRRQAQMRFPWHQCRPAALPAAPDSAPARFPRARRRHVTPFPSPGSGGRLGWRREKHASLPRDTLRPDVRGQHLGRNDEHPDSPRQDRKQPPWQIPQPELRPELQNQPGQPAPPGLPADADCPRRG